jgi:SAM-dependent methyltransferase
MGIGITELQFLKYLKKINHNFGDVLTLGRQQLGINARDIESILKKSLKQDYCVMDYCEKLLENEFEATKVESIDFSDYEGCTYIGNIGGPELNIKKKFDTIIDFGTIEHVFDIATAFKNINNHLKVGGVVMHSNPANSFCGHGFYQLSHELFFSLYAQKNGYQNTRVFIKDFSNKYKNEWFEVKESESGIRLEYSSKECCGNLVFSKKIEHIDKIEVFQKLYDLDWNKDFKTKKQPNIENYNLIKKFWEYIRPKIKQIPFFFIITYFRSIYHKKFLTGPVHFTNHKKIKKLIVKNLIN